MATPSADSTAAPSKPRRDLAGLTRSAQFGLAAVLVVATAALCGCAVPMTAMQPHAEGGRLKNRTCPPVPEFLLFRQDDVVAAVSTREAGPGRRDVLLSFEVPEGRTVRLVERDIEVITRTGERARSPLAGRFYGPNNQSGEIDPDSLMRGRTKRLRRGTFTGYGVTRQELFEFTAEFATALGDTFTVTLPKVLLDERPWDLPAVVFMHVRRWVFIGFNC